MSDLQVVLRLKADGSGIVSQEIKRVGDALGDTERKAGRAGSAVDRTRGSFARLREGAISLKGALAGLGIAASIREVVQISDAYANLDGRLRIVTDSSEELAQLQGDLFGIAQATSTAYADVATLYTRVAQNADDLNVAQGTLLDLTETTTKAFIVSGASAQETSGAVRQLTQALASGVFRGEEFNSVAEQGPRILKALTQELGVSRGELRGMAEAGQLTADLVIRAMVAQSDQIATEYDALPRTVGRAMTELRNEFERALASTDVSPVVEAIDDLTTTLKDPAVQEGLTSLASGLVTIADLSATAAAHIGGLGTALGETAAELALSVERMSLLDRLLLVVDSNALALAIAQAAIARDTRSASDNLALFGEILDDVFAPGLPEKAEALGQGFFTWGRGVAEAGGRAAASLDAFRALRDELTAEAAALASGREALDAFLREQEISNELAKVAKDVTAEQRAEIELLLRAVYAGRDALDAIELAQREAAEAAKEHQREVAQLEGLYEKLTRDAMTPAQRSLAGLADQMADVQRLSAAGFIDTAVAAELIDALEAAYLRAGELGDGVDDLYESLRRVFEPRFGANLSEELLDSLQGIEQIKSLFEGFDEPFNASINRMLDSLQTFAAASEKTGKEQTQSYLQGFAQMSQGAASMASEGSGAFRALTLASQVASVAAAVYGIANQAAGDPYTAFARMAAMAASMASLGIQVSGSFGGGGSAAGALDRGNVGNGDSNVSGTVLGDIDAGSESIVDAVGVLAEIARTELEFSSQMARSLANIESALAGVTGEFARISQARGVQSLNLTGSVGDVAAQVQSFDLAAYVARIFTSRGRRGSESDYIAAVASDIDSGIQAVFDELGGGITAAVEALGGDALAALERYLSIDLGEIVVREDDDLDAVISELFGSLGDSAVAIVGEAVGLGISRFQRFGEGALETLARVASGFEYAQDVVEDLGLDLVSLDGVGSGVEDIGAELIRLSVIASNQVTPGIRGLIETFVGGAAETADFATELLDLRQQLSQLGLAGADVTRRMIDAAGGLDGLADGIETFREQFFTEAEQFAILAEQLTGDLAGAGQQLPKTRAEFRALVESAQAAGLETLVGTLLRLAPLADEYYTALEDGVAVTGQAIDMASLHIRLMRAQGDELGALALIRERELDAATAAERAILNQIFAAEDAAAAQRELERAEQDARRATEEFTQSLQNTARGLLRQIADLRGQSVAAVDIGLLARDVGSANSLATLLDLVPGIQDALSNQLQEQIAALMAAEERQTQAIQNQATRAAAIATEQLEVLRDQASNLRGLLDASEGLRGFVADLRVSDSSAFSLGQRLAAAQSQYGIALAGARAGDSAAAQQLPGSATSLLALLSQTASTRLEYERAAAQIIADFDATADSIDARSPELLALQAQIDVLGDIRGAQDTQIAALSTSYEAQIGNLKQALADKLEGLGGILGLIESATRLEGDEQVAAMRVLQAALVDVLEDGNLDQFQGLAGVRQALQEAGVDLAAIDAGTQGVSAAANLQVQLLQAQKVELQKLTNIRDGIGITNGLLRGQLSGSKLNVLDVINLNIHHTNLGLGSIISLLSDIRDSQRYGGGQSWLGLNNTLLQAIRDNHRAANQQRGYPAFALGGDHAGGYRVVGERGPELEATGPARIFSAEQTARILRPGADTAALVRRLEALQEEVRELRRETREGHTAIADPLTALDSRDRRRHDGNRMRVIVHQEAGESVIVSEVAP